MTAERACGIAADEVPGAEWAASQDDHGWITLYAIMPDGVRSYTTVVCPAGLPFRYEEGIVVRRAAFELMAHWIEGEVG